MMSGSESLRTYSTALVVRFFSGFHAPSLSRITLPWLGFPPGKENFRLPYKALDDGIVWNVQTFVKNRQQARSPFVF